MPVNSGFHRQPFTERVKYTSVMTIEAPVIQSGIPLAPRWPASPQSPCPGLETSPYANTGHF